MKDVVGTSGRIDVKVVTDANLPVKSLGFAYKIKDGQIGIDLDTVWLDIPQTGVVGSSEVYGSPLLIAQTIIGVIQTGWALFHPVADIFIGEETRLTATVKGGKLVTSFGSNPPALRLHWSFLYGLITPTMQRPLTGFVLSGDSAVVQFHQSRWYRDVTIPVK